ncbi:MAG: GNAT family N-acetyltransferase [Gordonia sp. (in: high G+C Gram-positive bacteria)]
MPGPRDNTYPGDVYPGDRIVVRYRIGDTTPGDWRPASHAAQTAPRLSDITGFLVENADPLRISRNGVIESVPRAAITSMRLLSARPVRTSEIRALERAAALSWPGIESTWIEGWFVRAGGRMSRRGNSAIPLEMSARADAATLHRISAWYAERNLPTILALPDRLLGPHTIPGTPASGDVHILTRVLDGAGDQPRPVTDVAVALHTNPTTDWIRAYLGPDADVALARRIVTATEGPVIFASVTDPDGSVIGTGRATITVAAAGDAGWVGITALWTDPARRRHRIGDAILTRLLDWGIDHDAHRAYLQVEADNTIAGSWYRRRSFALHHTSRYLTAHLAS